MSPIANTSGCPGSVQSGCTSIRPARSHSAPAASASVRASGDAATPAAQILVLAGKRWTVPSGPLTSTPVASTPVTIDSVWISTPSASARCVRLPGQPVAEGGQDLLAAVEQEHPGGGWVDRGGSSGPGRAGRARRSGRRSPPRSGRRRRREGEPRLARSRGRPPARPSRTRRGSARAARARRRSSSSRAPTRELVVAEVGLAGAGGHDQAVVRDARALAVRPRGGHRPRRRGRSRSPPPAPPRRCACRRSTSRIGGAISPSERMPVATW